MEFKYGKPRTGIKRLTEKAINQIKERKYYERFLDSGKKIILLGVAFTGKDTGYKIEYMENV